MRKVLIQQYHCGGYKQSGIGRDNGYQALENYLQIKSTWIKIT